MKKGRTFAVLDYTRLIAALLVIAIHTSPLATFSAEADFWLTRVFARLAVPFFFMVTGAFLLNQSAEKFKAFLKKTALLYCAAMLLYLPINLMNGGYTAAQWLQRIFFEGTFYHLWYFPALIGGLLLARLINRAGPYASLFLAGLLYLAGLFGDSYYHAICGIPPAEAFYSAVFSVFGYTRNGLFFAPLFLLLGARCRVWRVKRPIFFFMSFLAGMSAEAFLLRGLGWPRHDSMYLLLPFCMVFLFSFLLSHDYGRSVAARRVSTLVYLLHPFCIVLVRGGAKLIRAENIFIQNSLWHFSAVCVLSFGAAFILSKFRRPKPYATARAWRELDTSALCRNADALKNAAGCGLMAVVKADAYGHGAKPVAQALQKHGVRRFAVACLSEGIRLRKAGVRGEILVLGYTPPEQAARLRWWRLSQTIVDAAYAEKLAAQKISLRVHLALDTGMRRLGVPAEDIAGIVKICRMPYLKLCGTFSHLCTADGELPAENAYTAAQLKRFFDAAAHMQRRGCDPGPLHIQASYGILNLPSQPCGFARSGIALYGLGSTQTPFLRQAGLSPVLSLRARVAAVRPLQPGDGAGYGLAFQARRPTRLAVVSIGYADGLPRDFALRGGRLLINGQAVPVVGNVCMDQLFADVTEAGAVASGDIATVIGRDHQAVISAQEVAAQCGCITNELLARLHHRLPVLAVNGGGSFGALPS